MKRRPLNNAQLAAQLELGKEFLSRVLRQMVWRPAERASMAMDILGLGGYLLDPPSFDSVLLLRRAVPARSTLDAIQTENPDDRVVPVNLDALRQEIESGTVRFVRSASKDGKGRIDIEISVDGVVCDGVPLGDFLMWSNPERIVAGRFSRRRRKQDPPSDQYTDHPHIHGRYGELCCGTFAPMFQRAVNNLDVTRIVDLLVQCMSTYNALSNYKCIEDFKSEPKCVCGAMLLLPKNDAYGFLALPGRSADREQAKLHALRCMKCGYYSCPTCIKRCEACGRILCIECSKECDGCKEMKETDELLRGDGQVRGNPMLTWTITAVEETTITPFNP